MSRRTLVPAGLDPVMTAFLDALAKPIAAVDDLAAGSTTAQCVTKINELLAALRAAKKMDEE